MPVDKHVHGQHPDHLGNDEGQGPEVEGPAVRVTILFGVALGGISGIGRYVHYDANDVTQTCRAPGWAESERRTLISKQDARHWAGLKDRDNRMGLSPV